MNQESKNIINLMSEVRSLFEQIAMLLGTGDQIFGEQGWSSANSSTVTGGNSASINHPRDWAPELFCRFYKNEKYPNILFYLGVIIDNRDNYQDYPKDFEPIITAGYYDYGDGETIGNWNIWRSRWHIYSDEQNYGGAICTLKPKNRDDFEEKDNNFNKLRSLALPLVSIKNTNDLKEKAIEPLLNDLVIQKQGHKGVGTSIAAR